MTAVGDVDTSLASKCMDFCQALAKQGQAFNFSLTVSSGFSFSLDTQEKGRKPSDQEEDKSLHPQEKCQEERGIPCKERA